MSNEELAPAREMTLDEWVARLPETHRVHKELKELKEDSIFLEYLRGAGVDNWDGFDFAMESLREANARIDEEKKKGFDVV